VQPTHISGCNSWTPKRTYYYEVVTTAESKALVRSQFMTLAKQNKAKRRRVAKHRRKFMRHELALGLHSQNVMGMSKTEHSIVAWFNNFWQMPSTGAHTVVFLQETHAVVSEIPALKALHSRSWALTYTRKVGFAHCGAPAMIEKEEPPSSATRTQPSTDSHRT
jgi:hypothetical protein